MSRKISRKNQLTIGALSALGIATGITTAHADEIKHDVKTSNEIESKQSKITDESPKHTNNKVSNNAQPRNVNIDVLNNKLDILVQKAKQLGITVNIENTKQYSSGIDAKSDIEQQSNVLEAAIKSVDDVTKKIYTIITNTEKDGYFFEGKQMITIDPTNAKDVNEALVSLETELNRISKERTSGIDKLNHIIDNARKEGIIVNVKGEKKVTPDRLNEHIDSTIKTVNNVVSKHKDNHNQYIKDLAKWENDTYVEKARIEKEYNDAMTKWSEMVKADKMALEKKYEDEMSEWKRTIINGHAQIENEYKTALDNWNKTVSEAKAKIEKDHQEAMSRWSEEVTKGHAAIDFKNQKTLNEWNATVAAGRAKVEKDYQDAINTWENTVATGKAKVEKEYQDALTQWNAVVENGKSKIESEYKTALASYNADVDKVTKQNNIIRQQNEATKEAFKNAVAKLSPSSMAKTLGDTYQQTVKQRVTETSSGQVTIIAKNGTTIVSAELVGPNGFKERLAITNNTVNYRNNNLTVGEYTVNYQFKSVKNTISDVTSTFIITTPDKIGSGSGSATFTTKAPMATNTENQIEPLITDHVYDYSSSYAGKVKDSLRLSKKIIEANKNPQSRHILQLYPDNYNQSSYHASTQSKVAGIRGISSTLLTKQQALEIIDRLLQINSPSEKNPTYPNYGAFFQGLADAFGNHRYLDETKTDVVPFEDIVNKVTKSTDTISVIQYTDGWMDSGVIEVMDKSFAEWAKGRAKTFMSVINRNKVTENDTNTMQSLNQMRALGHPNIYDMTGKDPAIVDAEVLKQFMESATVKVKAVKGEDQTTHIVLGGDGVTVTKATLKGNSIKQLPIKDGKVDVSEKLPDGEYSVEFSATGGGNLKYQITIDGKTVVEKTLLVTSSSKGVTSTETKTDKFEPVEQGKLIPELPIPQNKPIKGEYKEPPKPIKGEYKEPPKPIKGEYKEPPKPIKGEYKEPPKPVKGEYKEPPKPVKGEYKEPPKPVKGEYKEPPKPVKPAPLSVDIETPSVVIKKPTLDIKSVSAHKVSEKKLPETGDSGTIGIFGLGATILGFTTRRRKTN